MTESEPPPPPPPQREPAEQRTPKDPLRRSRTGGAWVGVVVSALLLVVLVIFIAQNTEDAQISFLWWEGSAPLAVALLIAAVTGIVITALIGTLRIWQLRRRVRRGGA